MHFEATLVFLENGNGSVSDSFRVGPIISGVRSSTIIALRAFTKVWTTTY